MSEGGVSNKNLGQVIRQNAWRFLLTGRSERGYVLAWVMILMLVSGLVIGPFLQLMMTGLRASQSTADGIQGFYAADSGIEDAIYRIQNDYSAITQLSADIGQDDAVIPVVSTGLFPMRGIIQIESEIIY
jgi:Tfp pilus assembly protein PilX